MGNIKSLLAFFCIILFVSVGLSFTERTAPPERNLKVLPKDISDKKLDSLMDAYCVSLGVKCKFCHTEVKNAASYININPTDSLDFASDSNPMKENARDMIKMQMDINSRYFDYVKGEKPVFMNVVHCNTCHRGQPMPFEK